MNQLIERPAMGWARVAPPVGSRFGFTNQGETTRQVILGGTFSLSLAFAWVFFLNGVYLAPGRDYGYVDDGIRLKEMDLRQGDRLEGVFLGIEDYAVANSKAPVRKRLLGGFSPEIGAVYFEEPLPPSTSYFDLYVGGFYVAPDQVARIESNIVYLLSVRPEWNVSSQCWANYTQIG